MAITMIRRAALLACGALALAGTGNAQAATALDYDVFALGNFTSAWTEVNGSLAAGGNVNVQGFSVGKDLGAGYSGASLVAGSNIVYASGTVFHGDAVAGGTITASGLTVANGVATQNAPVPVNFASEATRLQNLSASLSGLAANGAITSNGHSLTFTGTDAAVNVFNLTTSQLSSSGGFSVFIPEGSVAVFNVSGAAAALSGNGAYTINGQTIVNQSAGLASSLLFNFSDATALAFSGSWAGNVLAPGADATLGWGGFFGSLVANNISGNSEFYVGRFTGYDLVTNPPVSAPVPEPASWAMMIAGFGLIGGMLRRARFGKAAGEGAALA
ncbi:MAG: choice-of-anchor A family protein [Sphingomonas sp.]|nr:choice-of-anchor A family protein [Sphingomonas sp.]MDX3885654.1 choice-of-anchor A family protein [Sphingomonas sp.]